MGSVQPDLFSTFCKKKTEVCGKFSDIVSEISTNFTV